MKAGALLHRAVEGIRAVTGADGVAQQVRAPLQMPKVRNHMLTEGIICREFIRVLVNKGHRWHVAPAIKNDGARPITVHGQMVVPAEAFAMSLDDFAEDFVQPVAFGMVKELKGSCVFMSVPRDKEYATRVEVYDGVWLAINCHVDDEGRTVFSFETTARYIGEDDG